MNSNKFFIIEQLKNKVLGLNKSATNFQKDEMKTNKSLWNATVTL